MRRYLVLLPLFLLLRVSGNASTPVLAIGHRGNSLFAPENTVSSFVSARAVADFVETDGRVTSNGLLVIMHDATVDRTTDGTGAIASQTLAQLKLLDAGSWFSTNFIGERIPTLDEMLTNTLPQAIPLVEQKTGSPQLYLDTFRRLGIVTNIVLQSFDWNFLSGVHALEPSIRLCALGSGTLNAATLATITNSGARIVAWEQANVTPEVLDLVHGWGLALFVWTVDGPAIQTFIDMGVDGIISNDPGRVRALQQQSPTNSPAALAEGLVSYWRMDDGLTNSFATVVSDGTAKNPGTLTRNDGASHWFEGTLARFGGALKLEGTNAFVSLPPSPSLDINTNQLTISAWVRLQNLPSQLPTSFGAIFDSTTDCYVMYLDKVNKELRFKVTDTTGQAARPGIPESFLQTNQWMHIAATFSGTAGPSSGQATIYLNGQPRDVHTGDDSHSPAGLTGNVKTGQSAAMGREGPSGGNFFNGYIDDLGLWRRALTPGEVARIYSNGLDGMSLGDLLRQPTPLIQLVSAFRNTGGTLELRFKNLGPWQSFRLLHASEANGMFLSVPGLSPISLGGGEYRFDYSLGSTQQEFFRVEGW